MPTRSDLLTRHVAALERAEVAAARQLATVYNQARSEIVAKLIGDWNPSAAATPGDAERFLRNSGLLQQIDARMMQLEKEVGVQLRGIVTSSAEAGIAQIRREIALLPAAIRNNFTGTFDQINDRMIERHLYPALDGVRLATTSTALTLRRELSVGVVRGEAFPTLVRRLMANTPTGEGQAVWVNGRLSAERMVRRTVIAAENGAKVEAIGEVQRQIPEVKKQVFAVVGVNTTDCCLRAHGQIQPVDQPFILVGTPRFADQAMAPGFHWNCRTSVAMYHPAFEASASTAKMEADAKRELARRVAVKERKAVAKDERAAARVEKRVIAAAPVVVAPAAGLQYQPGAQQIADAIAHVDEQIAAIAETEKITAQEVEQTIRDAFVKLTAEARMAIQFDSKYIDALLTDGRFKTQFETGTSGGTNSQIYRANAEQKGLGIPTKGTDPQARPIYGYLDLGPGAREMTSQYGDLTFVVKEDVKQRTTVTAGDSLYNFSRRQVAGSPVLAPTKESWDTSVYAMYDYATGYGDANQMVGNIKYVEVQMQRGVTLADIRGVVDARGLLSAAQRAALQERGVEIWEN